MGLIRDSIANAMGLGPSSDPLPALIEEFGEKFHFIHPLRSNFFLNEIHLGCMFQEASEICCISRWVL
jgi:hypothetical protein